MLHSISVPEKATFTAKRSISGPAGSGKATFVAVRSILVRTRSTFTSLRQAFIHSRATFQAIRSILYTSGYHVYYRQIGASGEWIYVGFIPDTDDPLDITLPVLPDGDYEVQLRLQGYHWGPHHLLKTGRFSISGAAVVSAPLPGIKGLTYTQVNDQVRLMWTWEDQLGSDTPADFAIWTSATTPVDTSGAPVTTVTADRSNAYYAVISQAGAMYVAVAARDSDGNLGPVAEVLVPAASSTPSSPADQWAVHRELPFGQEREE